MARPLALEVRGVDSEKMKGVDWENGRARKRVQLFIQVEGTNDLQQKLAQKLKYLIEISLNTNRNILTKSASAN